MRYWHIYFDVPAEVRIEFNSRSRNLTVEVDGEDQRYSAQKLKCVTMYRISKAWPSCDDQELADQLTGLVERFNDDGGLEAELQLVALTLLYRHYGTAFSF